MRSLKSRFYGDLPIVTFKELYKSLGRKKIFICNIENNCHRVIADPRVVVGWVGSCQACFDWPCYECLCVFESKTVWERERERERESWGGCVILYIRLQAVWSPRRTRAHTHTHTHTHTHISESIHKSSQRVSAYCSDWASGICVLEHKRVQRQHTEGQTIGTSSLNWYKILMQIKLRPIRWSVSITYW